MRLIYGADGDERVVLFDDGRHAVAFFDFIGTPDEDYAAINVDWHSGAIIGVLVYPLAALAVKLPPNWWPA